MRFAFDKEDVFSVLEAEFAGSYIGEEGFFGDSLSELNRRIQREDSHTLIKCDGDDAFLAFTYYDDFENRSCALFIPACKIIDLNTDTVDIEHYSDFNSFYRKI